jgi:hypothetical protein
MHLLLTALLIAQSGLGVPPDSVFGAYQQCMMACRTIQILPDHTFVYRLDGDLYNDQRYKGEWTWLGPNRMRAKSPPDTSPPSVAESHVPQEREFVVTVSDPMGAVVQGATITPLYPQPGNAAQTNEKGEAAIAPCPEFEVRVFSYIGRHRPSSSSSNRFEVTLSIKQLDAFAIDEEWQIQDGYLYVIEADGSFNRDSGLRKLSKKRERAIFGRPAPN